MDRMNTYGADGSELEGSMTLVHFPYFTIFPIANLATEINTKQQILKMGPDLGNTQARCKDSLCFHAF